MANKLLKYLLREEIFIKLAKRNKKIFNILPKRFVKWIKMFDVAICWLPRQMYRRMPKINPKRIAFMTNTFNYTCNPKYICEALLESNVDCEIVWITDDVKRKRASFPTNIKLVEMNSLKCFEYVYSAKIWIDNGIAFSNYFDKKKGQIKIQTMHGSLGIKRLDNAVLSREDRGFFGKRVVRRERDTTDLVITNSLFEEEVFKTVFWKDTPMKRLGHARTDILFAHNKRHIRYIRTRLCEQYGIPHDKKMVLYGPTHRKGMMPEDVHFDYQRLMEALKERFGDDFVVLLRLHNRNAKMTHDLEHGENVFDVTLYPDMQELMLVADVAITDYSSWIYDYVVTYKPGFIYATDLERYNNVTGLYYKLEETPFPVSYNEQVLFENIKAFDFEEYKKKVKAFLDEKEAVDDGYSAKRIVAEIEKLLEEK